MYVPPPFKIEEQSQILQLMAENPLATVITIHENEPHVSHLPLLVVATQPQLKLVGHMARANKHWQHMAANPTSKIIFHGPNAYITPTWYEKNNVPTWNYAVVHISAKTALIEDFAGIVQALQLLSSNMESSEARPWEFWLPDDLKSAEDLTTAIIAFEMTVTSISTKFKLSQNRSTVDRERVMDGLRERGDAASLKLLNLMQSLRD